VTNRVVVRIAAISHEKELLTIEKAGGSSTLPSIVMNRQEIPDLCALELGNRYIPDSNLTLIGGFSHRSQLPGGPLMLTLPVYMTWTDGVLSICYAAVFNGRPAAGTMLPAYNIDDRFENGLGKTIKSLSAVDSGKLETTYDKNSLRRILKKRKVGMGAESPKDMTVAVFVNQKEKTLLLHHKKLNMWLPPGGHVESHESPDMAALREVKEETGLDIALEGGVYPCNSAAGSHILSGEYGDMENGLTIPMGVQLEEIGETHHHIDFVYFSSPVTEGPLLPNDESHGLGWYNRTEVQGLDLTDEMRLWCSKVWLSGRVNV
jgi:8-oxo-dGTP pyrophosphatase MutT (NUDIX family)